VHGYCEIGVREVRFVVVRIPPARVRLRESHDVSIQAEMGKAVARTQAGTISFEIYSPLALRTNTLIL